MLPVSDSKKIVIGIHGKKGSGKTTVSSFIRFMDPTFDETTFAFPLKPAAQILFNWEHLDLNNGPDKEIIDPRWGLTPRHVLQHLGTDYLRSVYGEDFFIKNLKHRLQSTTNKKLIVGDLRFPNEAEFIKNEKGLVFKIVRPGLESIDQHPSEIALDDYKDWDAIIVNDGTLADLEEKVKVQILSVLEFKSKE